MNRLLMSSLATLLVTACAHTGPSMSSADRLALYQANAGEPVTSFQHSQNLRWSALGDQALAVWSRRNQAYLVELRSSCQGLSSTPSISISNTGGITRRVSTFDSVRVTRPGGVVSQTPLPHPVHSAAGRKGAGQ